MLYQKNCCGKIDLICQFLSVVHIFYLEVRKPSLDFGHHIINRLICSSWRVLLGLKHVFVRGLAKQFVHEMHFPGVSLTLA